MIKMIFQTVILIWVTTFIVSSAMTMYANIRTMGMFRDSVVSEIRKLLDTSKENKLEVATSIMFIIVFGPILFIAGAILEAIRRKQ